MSMLSTILTTSSARSHFRKTSRFSYSVWRSVKNEHAFACQNGFQKVLINFQCNPYIKTCSVQKRLLSTSSSKYKEPSSKVEETVDRLKEKRKSQGTLDSTSAKVHSSIDTSLEAKILSDTKSTKEVTVEKKSIWIKIKNEVMHYYSGFKLFILDVKVSSKIIWKLLKGKSLTRRESRQLVRTTSVIFRFYYN